MARSIVCGFHVGTIEAATSGMAKYKMLSTVTGACSIRSNDPRARGDYCLQVSPNNAAAYTGWSGGTGELWGQEVQTQNVLEFFFQIWFPEALPSSDVLLAFTTVTSGNRAEVWYLSSTQTFGFKIAGQTMTDTGRGVAPGNKYHMNFYHSVQASPHVAKLGIDNIAAASVPTQSVSATATTFTGIWFGTDSTSQTYTACYDDVCSIVQDQATSYAQNVWKVEPLYVDPNGTITVTNSNSFNTFTSNGTMSSWDASTAKSALSEVPPVFGSTANGVAMIATGASDYMLIPMTTYTLQTGESSLSGRIYLAGWAASADPNTIGVKVRTNEGSGDVDSWIFDYQGTAGGSSTVADPEFNTTGAWISGDNENFASYNTQAELDSLAVLFGFSSDVTPNVGLVGLVYEVGIRWAIGDEIQDKFGYETSSAAESESVDIPENPSPNAEAVAIAGAANDSPCNIQVAAQCP